MHDTSSETSGQVRLSRLSGQDQGHMTKTRENVFCHPFCYRHGAVLLPFYNFGDSKSILATQGWLPACG